MASLLIVSYIRLLAVLPAPAAGVVDLGLEAEVAGCSNADERCKSEAALWRCFAGGRPTPGYHSHCYCAAGLPRRCEDACADDEPDGTLCATVCSGYVACRGSKQDVARPRSPENDQHATSDANATVRTWVIYLTPGLIIALLISAYHGCRSRRCGDGRRDRATWSTSHGAVTGAGVAVGVGTAKQDPDASSVDVNGSTEA